MLNKYVEEVSMKNQLVVNITNYVTVNDCANIILSVGASPIMSDDIQEIEELIKMCAILVINIGTLNSRTIEMMYFAAKCANEYNKPIILDPVGCGATKLRTEVALKLLSDYQISLVRGNASEIKSLLMKENVTVGVDVNDDDLNENHLRLGQEIACKFNTKCIISGPIDYICDSEHVYQCYEGEAILSKITGTGCMLTAYLAAFYTLEIDLSNLASLVAYYGSCATRALDNYQGISSFKIAFYDEISKIINFEKWNELKYEKIF